MNTNVRTSDLSDSIIRALVRQTHRTGFVLTSIYVHILFIKLMKFIQNNENMSTLALIAVLPALIAVFTF